MSDQLAGGADSIEKDAFVDFFDTVEPLPEDAEGGPVEKPGAEELTALFSGYCAADRAMTKAAFVQLVSPRWQVAKGTTLTSGLGVSGSKRLRLLKVGEFLDTLEGPLKEKATGLMRIRARASSDGQEGWATIAGNAGSEFLKECGQPA